MMQVPFNIVAILIFGVQNSVGESLHSGHVRVVKLVANLGDLEEGIFFPLAEVVGGGEN